MAGAILFPVGFCTLYLHGYDLLTGVFVLSFLAWLDKRAGVTFSGVLRNWGLVFSGNFLGAFDNLGKNVATGPISEVRLDVATGHLMAN